MSPGMPTDIQRLIKRMLEARTDRAEEVIPDMAYGGIIGLQGGGPPRKLSYMEMLRALGSKADSAVTEPRKFWLPEFDEGESASEIALEMLRGGVENVGGSIRDFIVDPVRDLGARLGGLGSKTVVDGALLGGVRRSGGTEDTTRALLEFAARQRVGDGRASGGIIGFQAGGDPYQQRMVQSYVSPEVAQPYADLTGRIQRAGAQPYTPYGGQRLAATTADQALARGAYGAYGRGAGPAGTQQAAATMGQAGQMLGGAYQGIAGLQPQYAQIAAQFGAAAPLAQRQAQQAAAGMRKTGLEAQAEQRVFGAGQAAHSMAGQQRMIGLGAGMATAGQDALAAQQQFGAGMQGLGAGAAGQAQAREIQMGGLSRQAGQLGTDIRGQLGGTGVEARQVGQIGAGDIRQAGLESQGLGQQALAGIGAVGGRAEEASVEAAQRMRALGAQAPQLGKGADLSGYMSQYTAGVTDPQLQQLMEFQRMQGEELGSKAAQAGAFGGSRADVEARKLREQTGQEASKIIGTGLKEAQQQAVEREREDARRREQAQQMGLSAEERAAAAQQAGTGAAQQAAAQGFGAAQQGQAARQAAAQEAVAARQQGIAALQQAQVSGGSAAQQAMGQQAQLAQQAAAAGQYGSDAQMRAQQQAAAMAQAGAGAYQQALAGQGALTGQGIGMGMRGLAAQRAAATEGARFSLQGQQQGSQAERQGWGTYGQLLGQQQGAIGAQGQAFGQMGQFGSQMGQLGGQQRLLGGTQQQQQLQRLQAMEQAGARTQLDRQRDYDIAHQDFLRQQGWDRQQIGWQLGAMQGLPYQNTQVIGDYGQTPGLASDAAGAMSAYSEYQAGQARNQAEIDALNRVGRVDTEIPDPVGFQPDITIPEESFPDTAEGGFGTDPSYPTTGEPPSYPTPGETPSYPAPGGAHGGYLSSSGILAPYHKKLIDGLYAGGRINY